MGTYLLNFRFRLAPWLMVFGLWVSGAVPPAAAEEPLPAPWQISADKLTRYQRPDTLVAEGQVVLTREKPGAEPMVIRADWMRYDVDLGRVKARGNVSLETPEYLIEAAETSLALDRETGILLDSTIIMHREGYNLYITGREIEKTGELTYHVEQGTVTSCPRTPDRAPPWELKSGEVRVKKEGMAVLKHATLNVQDVPVAYTPYLVFPANTERKSGFLLPELSSSERSGTGLITPYFVNLSPSHDLTLYPGYYTERGPLAGIEARYVADARSLGTMILTYLRDRTEDTPADDYLGDGFLRTDNNRYWVRGKVDHYFSDSLVARLDLDLVSDRDFLQEFRDGLLGYDATNRQFLKTFNRGLQEETVLLRTSTLQAVKSWSNMLLMGEVQGVQDVRDIDPLETPVQTLPRLLFNGRTLIADTPFSVAWDSEVLNYWREEGIGYQRLDVHPRLITSMPLGVLEGHLAGGVRQTSYVVQTYGDAVWDRDRFQNRTIEDFEAEIATTLFRDFAVGEGAVRSFTHTVRPTVIYNYIPSKDQTSLPRDSAGNPIDAVDLIEPKNLVTYQLNNHFDLGEALAGGAVASRYLGYFRVSQTYDIREDRRRLVGADDQQRQFSDVLVELDIYPLRALRLNYETAVSIYGQGVTYYKILSSYSDARGNSAFVDFNYQRDPSATRPFFFIDQAVESEQKLTLGVLKHLTETLTVQGDMTEVWRTEAGRDVDDLDQSLRILYHPGCWALELTASKTTDDKRIALVFSLTGIGDLLGLGMAADTGLQYEVL